MFRLLLATTFLIAAVYAETTQPQQQDVEPVFTHVSSASGHPITRKEKQSEPFETAHKLPPSVTYVLHEHARERRAAASPRRRTAAATTTAAPAPAPAGSIRLNVQQLLAKYKDELKTSTTTKASVRTSNKRIKKEARTERNRPTSPRPVLTSGAPSTPRSLEVKEGSLVTSSSDKQRSRIQIKKGPNGQEYEYEYVYYYYDDDEEKPKTNAHDGPAREEPQQQQQKTFRESSVNEIIPNRGKTRGRQLEDEDVVGEDRLPANTRFPPRSRNLATTPLPDSEKPKIRIRGKPTTAETDSISEETQGTTRGRTRANVRRPSLDLVDSESFNTHSAGSAANAPANGGPSFPADLPAGPVRFLGATPNERMDLQDVASRASESVEEAATDSSDKEDLPGTTANNEDTSTAMSPMDKVALDLYAILQGTQKLSGEEETNTEDIPGTTEEAATTLEPSTDAPTTTEIPTTTTTTTTTTTPAPTTTTTTEPPAPAFGKGRLRGNKPGLRKHHGSTTSTETPADSKETKPKSRFGRPSFGRPRPGGRSTTAEPAHEEEATKEESKPRSSGRPSFNRRFGSSRTKPTTDSVFASSTEEGAVSSSARPSLTRPRPAFQARGRVRTTTSAAPAESESSQSEESASSSVEASTSPKPKVRPGAGVRPLRPGPRLNLARGRPGQHTTTTTPATEEKPEEVEESHSEEVPKESESTSAAPQEDKSPLGRLRNRHKANGASLARPKAAASAPVQVRRLNPLLARKRPGATTEAAPSSEATPEPTEAPEEPAETEAPPSSTTTEEPRGLNKLLAGRRRLAARNPANH